MGGPVWAMILSTGEWRDGPTLTQQPPSRLSHPSQDLLQWIAIDAVDRAIGGKGWNASLLSKPHRPASNPTHPIASPLRLLPPLRYPNISVSRASWTVTHQIYETWVYRQVGG